MLAIQQSLTGPTVPGILAPARNFIYEGKLLKVCYVPSIKICLSQTSPSIPFQHTYTHRFAIGPENLKKEHYSFFQTSLFMPSQSLSNQEINQSKLLVS